MPRRHEAGSLAAPLARWRGLAWPLGLAALAVTAALLWLPYLDIPLHVDAAGYATAAYWWARGDTLYRDFTITRPQGIFVVFRAIEALGLGSIRGIHAVAAVWTALCALALAGVAARVWGRGIGLLSGFLFALVMATPHLQGFTVDAELFMLLPLLGGVALLLWADDRPLGGAANCWLLAACGLAGAVALLLKPSGVAALPFGALWMAHRWRVERAPWGAWLRAEAALGLGFAAGLAPAIVHGLLTVPDLYLNAVLFNRLAQDSALVASPAYQWHRFANNSAAILVRLPILLLAAPGLWAAWRGRDARARDLLALWLVTSFGGAALGGNWYLHYYQQVLPPLAVAVALGLVAVARRPTSRLMVAGQGLALAGVVALGLTLAPLLAGPVDPATLPEYEPVVSAVAPVAAYLRAHTAPDDTIYVAYDRADIYYLSERRPAARWLYFRELEWTPGAFVEQVVRLADPATAPRYIVGAQDFDDYGFDGDAIRAVVARDYTLETTIEGIPIYRRLDRPASGAATGRPE
ncbi:MAG TPA: hypothetical protein VFL91_05480, partial [Thermomicrobiales bacterium]|nr:hypothetical protein [Thermomicrobiales bacterium]